MTRNDPDRIAGRADIPTPPTKLRIPPAGSDFTLAKDWTFQLHLEGRNSAFISTFGIKFDTPLPQFGAQTRAFTLPAGTSLRVAEYSIRRGGFSPDSRVVFSVAKGERRYRIWVSLEDANGIETI